MRFLASICCLLLNLVSFSQENNVRITVNFSEDINDSVFLNINKNTYRVYAPGNSVVFDLYAQEASKAWLSMKNTKCLISFYTDPGEIDITAEFFETDGRLCITKKKITGSKTEEALSRFDRDRQKIEKKFIAEAANKNLAELSFELIKQYPRSPVSVDIIYRVRNELGKEWTEAALDMIDDSLSHAVKDHIMKTFRSDEFLQKGNYIDFTQNDIDGSPFTLSSLKGKYVLLDFWASWCAPCRKENPKLKLLYEKYKDKGLEVVGVSLDENEEKWMDAVEKDDLPWIHISDLKGWNNEISSTLGIQSIPTTILIDPDGKIVDFNLRGNELEKAVAKMINNKD